MKSIIESFDEWKEMQTPDNERGETMTELEKITNNETRKHILQVGYFINAIITALLERSEIHDRSKLQPPEITIFTEYTPKLKDATYSSDEYNGYLKEMKVALDHHYLMNRHHPEHHRNWLHDMNLIDLIEMFCDWKAASLRHADGDINKSIDINGERFNIAPQILSIFRNTIKVFEDKRVVNLSIVDE